MLCLFLLLTQLSKALRLLWSGKWAVFTPASLVFAVRRFIPSFDNYQQQDAQEFLDRLMDLLHEELRRGGVPAQGVCRCLPAERAHNGTSIFGSLQLAG